MADLDPANGRKLALLIDADNVRSSFLPIIIREASAIGTIVVRRVYGHFASSTMQPWQALLHEYALTPVHVPPASRGKNATDMKLAIEAMEAGKDVMVDKPGCTTLEQLAALRACVARTGRIWSVNFSERFEVPAVTRADELVRAGAIGRVIQTVGLGPHRQRLHTRPEWYFEKARFGGILCDIGSHQVDQFLHFTGSTEVEIAHALAENSTRPEYPGFENFGEIVLNGDAGHGYIRVDWFTPDALPVWGDGRLFILGDEGSIELRKYVDLARSETGNHLLLSNRTRVEHIDCRDAGLPYFPRLAADIRDRTETAAAQEHTFRTMEIAIRAQMKADARLRPGG